MKRILLIFQQTAVLLLLVSCSREKTENPNYIKFDSKSYDLNYGYICDYGTDENKTYREYFVSLQDKEDYPFSFIQFYIYSPGITELKTGTYSYCYSYGKVSTFTWLSCGKDLLYDDVGVLKGGTVLSETNCAVDTASKITITKNEENTFIFDLIINAKVLNGSPVVITGKFAKPVSIYLKL